MDQEVALAILKTGKNVFLTGSAGTGKTYVLNQYIQYLKERKVEVAITASTGIAATHMNGMTIHSWAGIGIKNFLSERDIVNLKQKQYLRKKMNNVKVLVIDEISMLHKNQIALVDQVLRSFKRPTEPFGGIQVVFCGDFFQLPPIGPDTETAKDKFAFMSPAWVNANPLVCYLSKQYRQNDMDLSILLNEIRSGEPSDLAFKFLDAAMDNMVDSEDTITRLFTHNADVDRINEQFLHSLESKLTTFKASTSGNPVLAESLKSSVLAPTELKLCVGARVMFVKNNYEAGYVNGTLGTVVDYSSEGFPIVKTLDKQKITTELDTWSVDDDSGKPLATYEQVPLRLAWAITIHKSQGMTLDAAEIDLRRTFEAGQGYVALSRLRDASSLFLRGYNEAALAVDSLALKADVRFQELSQEAEGIFEPKTAEKLAKLFMDKIGGLSSTAQIEAHKAKTREKTKTKKSTYLITKEYIANGLDIADIAKERGLTRGTVIGHLDNIKTKYPSFDLERFRPDGSTMKKILRAIEVLQKKENSKNIPGLKTLHEHLKGKLSYEEIKLALVFAR